MSESEIAWSRVRAFMERTCGVVLEPEQRYLLEARLLPLARQFKSASVVDFATAACAAPGTSIALALIDAMTTHETSFFRDSPFWQNLELVVLPRLIASAAPRRTLRIWLAACSTGQEAYSLAMLLEERFPQLAASTEIHATDVSELSVARAASGVFPELETNRGLTTERLLRHFAPVPGGHQVKEPLRRRIQWAVHNLMASAHPTGCDLVLCRNVLIYFREADRLAVTARLFRAARAGGVVGVGTTESLRGPAPPIAPGLYPNETTAR